jgi:hypothetical protein
VRSYHHPKRLLSPFEGNAQFLADGHIFVGWGGWPYVSELSKDGRVLFDAYFGHGKPPGEDADTYRAYRFVWHGHPTDVPATALRNGKVYVSWNGATDVRHWRLMTGNNRDALTAGAMVLKSGFETGIPLPANGKYVAVQALDANGKILAVSKTLQR